MLAIKNVETARKLQDAFTEKFAERMEALRGGEEMSLERLREEKQRRIDRISPTLDYADSCVDSQLGLQPTD